MTDLNLQGIHDDLVAVAFEAGKMILAANPQSIDTGTKLNSADIVTETDQAVEKMVTERLQALYPAILFMGEETFKPGMKVTDAPTFIVDPIDGTTNFVHGFPNACISLGLAVGRVPAVGVVYNPFQDLLFTGIVGHGAYMTRSASTGTLPAQTLPLSGAPPPPLTGLSTALIGVEWGSSRDGENFRIKADVFRRLAASEAEGGAMVHSMRSLGSAALNLAAVAAGQLDLYWEGGCWPWDVCAAWCILTEAGGRMVGGNPGEWDIPLDRRVYLAVRGASSGQEEIVKAFWEVIGEGRLDYEA